MAWDDGERRDGEGGRGGGGGGRSKGRRQWGGGGRGLELDASLVGRGDEMGSSDCAPSEEAFIEGVRDFDLDFSLDA